MGNCAECVSSKDSLVNLVAESRNFEYFLFTKSNCPESIKARTMLFTKGKMPKIMELHRADDKLKNALIQMTKKDKPPYIFYNREYLGGVEELESHLKKTT
ncbi:hypothetical protein SteCoe_9067 [Stentor coeruleus]|uniref:Glutaredoxin domain-containing protein n=1 Tax=Stentor coeruleus TaxID=5963 RepID=A0A1R2CIN6_9CILI|nr:hypothetical protein SteCoe_9067 [Stentor coeruleus]